MSRNATNHSNFNHKTIHHWQIFKSNYGQYSQQFVSTVAEQVFHLLPLQIKNPEII